MEEKEIQDREAIFKEIRILIDESRQELSIQVNATMSMLYWQIGNRINKEVLKDQRAEYGQQILATLSGQLIQEYGSSFSEKNLRRMLQFAEVFPDSKIVVSLIRQLSWTPSFSFIAYENRILENFEKL